MSDWTKHERIRVDNCCSLCQRLHETYDHTFHCPASKQALQTELILFHTYLQHQDVAPPMIQCMLHRIHIYLTPSTPPFDWSTYPSDSFLQLVQLAYTHQLQIGWSNFLRSCCALTRLCAHGGVSWQSSSLGCRCHWGKSRVPRFPVLHEYLCVGSFWVDC